VNWRDWLPSWGRKSVTSLDLFREIYGSKQSKTGQPVGLREALRCATVFACARVIANGIAQVPLKLYREDESTGRKTTAREHPLYRVLHRKPNPWQTSFEFRETIALHLALAGRAYAFKTIVGGRIKELIPFEPGKVTTKLADDGMTVVYTVTGNKGQSMEFDGSLIWHIKGPSWSGWEGLDALDMAREAIGLSIATEESQAKLHKNGVRTAGVYSVEGSLSQQQYKDLRKFLADNYAGESSGLPMIVDRAAKWLPMALNGVDAQHLETRKHQVVEICRAMGVMPIMVFESDKAATYASAEAMFQAHVVHTLAPWWERIEQSIDCNLLTEADDVAGIYSKFVGAGLLRGSMKDRADYFAKALGSGGSPAWMTQDEVRSLEEMNPMGGDAAKLPIASNVPRPAPAQ
jgi:HK97 family phage portal protein